MISHDMVFKVCIFASNNTGKETLARNYLDRFDQDKYSKRMMNIGASLGIKSIEIDGKRVKLFIPICSSEEPYQFLRYRYITGSNAIILLYDITNAKSFDNISEWCQLFNKKFDRPVLLVGNKVDLEEQREVSKKQVNNLKEKYDIPSSMEISLKTGENVNKMFKKIIKLAGACPPQRSEAKT